MATLRWPLPSSSVLGWEAKNLFCGLMWQSLTHHKGNNWNILLIQNWILIQIMQCCIVAFSPSSGCIQQKNKDICFYDFKNWLSRMIEKIWPRKILIPWIGREEGQSCILSHQFAPNLSLGLISGSVSRLLSPIWSVAPDFSCSVESIIKVKLKNKKPNQGPSDWWDRNC